MSLVNEADPSNSNSRVREALMYLGLLTLVAHVKSPGPPCSRLETSN